MLAYIRYSEATLRWDQSIVLGLLVFISFSIFLLFQLRIYEDEEIAREKEKQDRFKKIMKRWTNKSMPCIKRIDSIL